MNLFTNIGNFVDSIFDFLQQSSNTNTVQILSHLLGISIALLIMFKGYQHWAGKSSDPIKELVWDITIKVTVVGVALNLGGYLDAIKLAMEELHQIAGGGVSLYAELDKLFLSTSKLSNALADKGNYVTGYFYGLFPYLGFLIGSIPLLFVAIITDLTIKILFLLLPITIFLYIYPWFKKILEQYIAIFVSNSLLLLILSLIMGAIIQKYNEFQIQLLGQVSSSDIMIIAIQSLIMGLILLGITKVAVGISEKLGTISIDTLSGNALKSGVQDTFRGTQTAAKGISSAYQGGKNVIADTSGYIQSKISPTIPKIPKPR